MSEFTSGNLILNNHKKIMETYFTEKHQNIKFVTEDLNSKWTAFFTKDFLMYKEAEVPDYILELSQQCPIFYFYNYDDNGWGYRIFLDGDELADLDISHELDYFTIERLVKERYPEVDDITEFLYDTDEGSEIHKQIKKEIEQSRTNLYIATLEKWLIKSNIDVFKAFDIHDDIIHKLKSIINPEYLLHSDLVSHKAVEEFKKLLNLDQMHWMSYDYVIGRRNA